MPTALGLHWSYTYVLIIVTKFLKGFGTDVNTIMWKYFI